MSTHDQMEARVASATRRLATLKARQLLRELQAEQRKKAQARKADSRRCSELGSAVVAAGLGDWHAHEIIGVLIQAKEHVGGSRTMRMSYRERGEQHMRGTALSERSLPDAPTPRVEQ